MKVGNEHIVSAAVIADIERLALLSPQTVASLASFVSACIVNLENRKKIKRIALKNCAICCKELTDRRVCSECRQIYMKRKRIEL